MTFSSGQRSYGSRRRGTDRPSGASNPCMSEFSEDLRGPQIAPAVEAYFAEERSWGRLLRGTGAMNEEQARAELRRWLTDER